MNMITYEDFAKLDLRVAKVLSAERIEGSERLLKLQVDVGEFGQKQIIAGIGAVYTPEAITGKLIIIINNLEPRKLMGYDSNGMLLAADNKNGPVILCPSSEVPMGSKIK